MARTAEGLDTMHMTTAGGRKKKGMSADRAFLVIPALYAAALIATGMNDGGCILCGGSGRIADFEFTNPVTGATFPYTGECPLLRVPGFHGGPLVG